MDPQLSELSSELEDSHWWFTARARMIASIGTHLHPSPARVVEIGCGTGNVLAAFPADWHRVGVDVSPEAIAIAEARHPHLQLVTGSAPNAVEEELRATDLVLFCDVLEHIEDDLATFRSVIAALPPGAEVLITVPAGMELWSPHDVSHGHFRRYDAARLSTLWEGEALHVRLVTPFNYRLYPVARLVREATRRTRTALGPSGTDLVMPPKPLNWLMRRIFLSELRPLLRSLDSNGKPPRLRGVSWMAILEKQ